MIPLQFPVGVYRNGTNYQSKGRWFDSNLVRFEDNTIRPISGWRERSDDAVVGVVRGVASWKDNSDDIWVAAGTATKLYVYTGAGVQSDITPAGLTAGRVDAYFPNGYGNTFYGTSYYGVARPQTTAPDPATTWSLDTFGQYLLACSSDDGKVYEWQLNTGSVATQVTNAPIDNVGIVVTAERFLFCLGAGGNPKLVQWADRESLTDWTPTATNEAGDLELQTTGQIMCAKRVQGQTLIITTNDAHIAQYQGPPYVYGFEKVGSSCDIISKKAVATIDQGAIWMGDGSFHIYSGGGVRELPCEVSDYVFSGMNTAQVSKVFAMTNSKHSEVWWFYPSKESTENNRYVVYNYKEGCWYIGSMVRTAGVDSGAFTVPLMFHSDGKLYDHEVGFDYQGSTPYLESGPFELGNGEQVMSITSMIPDEGTQGDVYMELFSKFYPNGEEYSHGIYNMSNPTDMRVTARQVRIRLTANNNNDWRVGVNRLEVKPGGKR